ncbi:hypothetical protein [Burkholderia anthina]|uniref:hypothetical protein n=1 Tax=Burkholderia anthina TaxID=179879 RepID=UPI0015885EEB|nr:hypothetical protein [Burkholderia anthina]
MPHRTDTVADPAGRPVAERDDDTLAWRVLGAHVAGLALGAAIIAAATTLVCGVLRVW